MLEIPQYRLLEAGSRFVHPDSADNGWPRQPDLIGPQDNGIGRACGGIGVVGTHPRIMICWAAMLSGGDKRVGGHRWSVAGLQGTDEPRVPQRRRRREVRRKRTFDDSRKRP
jgi:hypothetical protein